jgi:type VI protein secretion system component VasF
VAQVRCGAGFADEALLSAEAAPADQQEPLLGLIATYAVPLAVIAVFLVLLAGLRTMMKGDNPNLSQRLMRWRVGLQFIAVVVIMLAVYLKRGL